MLEILYQDQDLIAVNKPTGLLSVPGRGPDKQDCVIARLLPEFPEIRCIHRLDRDTSGILLLGLSAFAQRELSRQFETRRVEKRYEAIVFGHLEQPQGLIDLPLAKDFSAPPRHRVDDEYGRPAQTSYSVMSEEKPSAQKELPADKDLPTTRLSLSPHTGRSHQLRVHLAALGHPILGDPLYASPEAMSAAARLMLHACELTFFDPCSEERIVLISACPF